MKKTLAKALTYRVLSLVVTAVIGWVMTGSVAAALSFGLVDSVFKMGLYSAHEAAWAKVSRVGVAAAVMSWALTASATFSKSESDGVFVKGGV